MSSRSLTFEVPIEIKSVLDLPFLQVAWISIGKWRPMLFVATPWFAWSVGS